MFIKICLQLNFLLIKVLSLIYKWFSHWKVLSPTFTVKQGTSHETVYVWDVYLFNTVNNIVLNIFNLSAFLTLSILGICRDLCPLSSGVHREDVWDPEDGRWTGGKEERLMCWSGWRVFLFKHLHQAGHDGSVPRPLMFTQSFKILRAIKWFRIVHNVVFFMLLWLMLQ